MCIIYSKVSCVYCTTVWCGQMSSVHLDLFNCHGHSMLEPNGFRILSIALHACVVSNLPQLKVSCLG